MTEKDRLIKLGKQIRSLREEVKNLQQQRDYPNEGIAALEEISWADLRRMKLKTTG